MGCEPSNTAVKGGPEIKITIIDSAFMKSQNEQIRKEMLDSNIKFQYFISMECFLEEFSKRYYSKVVTTLDKYPDLKKFLDGLQLTPKIFVNLNGKTTDLAASSNVVLVQNYNHLIKILKQNAPSSLHSNSIVTLPSYELKKLDVKIFSRSGSMSSQQIIFEAVLKKSGITYQFFNNFEELQRSSQQTITKYVVTDNVFHREVIQLFKNSKTRIICCCSLDKNQSYSPQLYFLSDNYLDIANQLKSELKSDKPQNSVKCSKVYLYTNGLQDLQEIRYTLESFQIEVRQFNNMEKVIKQTTYFFCVTILALQSEINNLAKYFQRNDYNEKIKLIPIPATAQPSLKGLNKIIRDIKKGYSIKKGVTTSIDIIDKHYSSTKFEQIKKQLESNNIKCFGFKSISEYIKNKKFISSFIITNYQERNLLVKYMKQLQCKSKIIVFCNKNKIDNQLKNSKHYTFVSSHFGKIIKFVKKTHVFMPLISRQDDQQFKDKIDKIKSKNKRISAIKWSQIATENCCDQKQQNFQFLNISKGTNNGSIRDIQKSVATIWKLQSSIFELSNFKQSLTKSLNELRKIHKINSSQAQFNQLIQIIKASSFSQLLEKVKTFFDSDNQLGLQINKSLMRTQSLEKKQITYMRQFLLLVFMNFISGYQMPKIGRKKVTHWISNSLIQKCQIDSFLFSKHFLIFYENSDQKVGNIGKYKMELQIDYNTLTQSELMLNSFINYKDKIIFSPFSQFKLQKIQNCGEFKIVSLKYVKNVDFLKYIYQQNLIKQGQNIEQLGNLLKNPECQLVDSKIRQSFNNNLDRVKAIEQFQKGDLKQSIETHKKLIKYNEEKQNLDSALVNELSFQLACFYFKGEMNRDSGAIIKQVLDSAPGQFIKQECQKMIKQAVEEDKNDSENKKRRISEQALKTFVWLKNKEQEEQKEDLMSNQTHSDYQADEHDINIFQRDMNCIEVDDIDDLKEISQHGLDFDKENIQEK